MEFIDFDIMEKHLKVALILKRELVYGVCIENQEECLYAVVIKWYGGDYKVANLEIEKAEKVYYYFKTLITKSDELANKYE